MICALNFQAGVNSIKDFWLGYVWNNEIKEYVIMLKLIHFKNSEFELHETLANITLSTKSNPKKGVKKGDKKPCYCIRPSHILLVESFSGFTE